jgi:hypothetical protein
LKITLEEQSLDDEDAQETVSEGQDVMNSCQILQNAAFVQDDQHVKAIVGHQF